MTRLQQSIITLCPVLNLNLHSSQKFQNELVFQFRSEEQVEPLFAMLRKYELDASIDIVDKWKFLFITF